jgi:hypothetical protein
MNLIGTLALAVLLPGGLVVAAFFKQESPSNLPGWDVFVMVRMSVFSNV